MTDFTADHTTETTFQVNSRGMTTTPAIEDHIRAQIHQHLGAPQATDASRSTSDENEPHRDTGDDKRCLIEARPAGRDPLVAEHTCGDMYEAIDSAVSNSSASSNTNSNATDGPNPATPASATMRTCETTHCTLEPTSGVLIVRLKAIAGRAGCQVDPQRSPGTRAGMELASRST